MHWRPSCDTLPGVHVLAASPSESSSSYDVQLIHHHSLPEEVGMYVCGGKGGEGGGKSANIHGNRFLVER